jgi:hypothetical protein
MARVLAMVEGALIGSRRRFKGFGDEKERREIGPRLFYNADMRGNSICWRRLDRCRQCRSKESEREWTGERERKKKKRRSQMRKRKPEGVKIDVDSQGCGWLIVGPKGISRAIAQPEPGLLYCEKKE